MTVLRNKCIFYIFASIICLPFIAAAEGEEGLKTLLSAGIALTDGNTESIQLNASLTTEGEREGLGSMT